MCLLIDRPSATPGATGLGEIFFDDVSVDSFLRNTNPESVERWRDEIEPLQEGILAFRSRLVSGLHVKRDAPDIHRSASISVKGGWYGADVTFRPAGACAVPGVG